MTDVVIIGGGHNGLGAAFYLARAGRKPVVLEQLHEPGGGAITGEILPGFHVPVLSHEMLLHARIVRDMDLARHGVEFLSSPVDVLAPVADGSPVVLFHDTARSAESLRPFSAKDAEAYPRYREALTHVASVLSKTFTAAPPDINRPAAGDLWNLLKTARAFRSLGTRDQHRLLRWVTMPAADLAREWFETGALCAAIAAPGVSGTMFGPRSAGSALVLLMREAHRALAGGPLRVRGGPGALTRAMTAAATAAGAEIRTNQRVDRLLIAKERVTGVVSNGREIPAQTVVSAIDPKTTFLRLIDPAELSPDLLVKARNYRASGAVAKINLALTALPDFRGGDSESLSGRIHIGPSLDHLERAFDHAKYGEVSEEPWLDLVIPSLLDPALAPAGAHVASVYVHYAPYRLRSGDWSEKKPSLVPTVLKVLERYAPNITSLVAGAQTFTPADLEATYGFWGGHIFHGELSIDQWFTMRPLLGHARYASPIQGLYLCGAGTHPGGFMTGASGRLAAHHILKGR